MLFIPVEGWRATFDVDTVVAFPVERESSTLDVAAVSTLAEVDGAAVVVVWDVAVDGVVVVAC